MGHARKIEDIRRLKRTYIETKNNCMHGVTYDEDKQRLIKHSYGPTMAQYRRYANKALRHKVVDGRNRSAFKRAGMSICNNL